MSHARIRLANAPCSWGVLEFEMEGPTVEYERFLDELARAGYVGTELGDWGFMPTDPDELRAALDGRDLALLAAFVPVSLADPAAHDTGIDTAVQTAELLAAVNPDAFIVLADDNGTDPDRTKNAGRISAVQRLADGHWATFVAGVERLARAVADRTGLRTVFHHHCAGFVETPDEVDRLMQHTDPDVVGLCFDTGHWTFAGGDALEGMRRYAERIWHVHFKDCEPHVAARSRREKWDYFESVRHGVFCELGKGAVDFPGIVKTLEAEDYDGWIVVEQDVLPGMGTPLDSAVRNREYLKTTGL